MGYGENDFGETCGRSGVVSFCIFSTDIQWVGGRDISGCSNYEACVRNRESDNEDEDGMSVAEVKENAAKKNTQDITAFFGKKNGAVDGKSNKKKKTVQSVKVPKYVSSLGLKRATKLI